MNMYAFRDFPDGPMPSEQAIDIQQPVIARRTAGFTLVELLVVIGLVAVLSALVMHAMSALRESSQRVSEMSAARTLGQAWNSYAIDNSGRVLPGYHYDQFEVTDAFGNDWMPSGEEGEELILVKRWPWRLAGYLGSNLKALYTDVTDMRLDQLSGEERNSLLYQVSVAPSFGMNSVYVGGDENYGGFSDIMLETFGQFYVDRLSKVRHADDLIVFTTARGTNGVPGSPDAETVEGYFRVLPPAYAQPLWDGEFDDADPGSAGNVSPRHGGDAITVTVDGRVATESIEELRDMRKWCDKAGSSDWLLTPR